jgi:hypothetical protein
MTYTKNGPRTLFSSFFIRIEQTIGLAISIGIILYFHYLILHMLESEEETISEEETKDTGVSDEDAKE